MGNQEEKKLTPTSTSAVVDAINGAWSEKFGAQPDKYQTAKILAHLELESGPNFSKVYNNNLGNIDVRGVRDKASALKSPHNFYLETDTRTVSTSSGKKLVSYTTFRRAYASLKESVADYLSILTSGTINAIKTNTGNANALANSLSAQGYHDQSTNDIYSKSLNSLYNKFLRDLLKKSSINPGRLESYASSYVMALHNEFITKLAKDVSYSSIMRELRKSQDEDAINKFQTEFKKNFDEALLNNSKEPENDALDQSLLAIDKKASKKVFQKAASAIDLGDPVYAGEYLANLIKFLLRRISPSKRQHALELMKSKIFYINEYEIASKKVPASAAYGQAITLLKHLLIEHHPQYVRDVLNNIVKHL